MQVLFRGGVGGGRGWGGLCGFKLRMQIEIQPEVLEG